ncbi:MAG: HAMP domain-containing histidine kinase [Eubacterium sp.]|nr:HAMP domain-containing histidine kinase [Eubacterium sp.]
MKLTTKILLAVVVPLCAALVLEFFFINTITNNIILDDVINYTEYEAKTLITELQKNAGFIDRRSKQTVQQAVILYCFTSQREHASRGCDYVLLDGVDGSYNGTTISDDVIREIVNKNVLDKRNSFYYRNEGNEQNVYCIIGSTITLVDHMYTVAVVKDITGQMASLRTMKIAFVLISGIISLVLLLIIFFVIRRQLRPLNSLKTATDRISKGNFGERIEVITSDEVGELAISFNRMSEALSYYVKEMQNAADEQNMFLHSITHELRTPVTAITGYAYALQSAKLSSEQRDEALGFVYSESFRLQSIVERLSKLMRIEEGKIECVYVPAEKLHQTLDALLTPEAEEYKLDFTLQTEPDFEIYGDKDLLVMLVTNLFNNAYKANATKIEVHINRQRISVQDNGCGIEPDKIDKLTQPFYQVDDSRNHEGFGLGLTFCQRIAQIHHSEIDIQSEPGKGSTFSMKLENTRESKAYVEAD